MKDKFNVGLDAINIAPEFGQFETDIYSDIMNDLQKPFLDEFYNICYRS